MRFVTAMVALAFLPPAANALDLNGLPAALAEKVTLAEQACVDVDDGEFAVEWGAVTRTDLDGDLSADWVLDESAFACSTAVSLFCSTGGCMSHFLIGDDVTWFATRDGPCSLSDATPSC